MHSDIQVEQFYAACCKKITHVYYWLTPYGKDIANSVQKWQFLRQNISFVLYYYCGKLFTDEINNN